MAFIDGTVVNVALPALQASLGATVLDVQWVVEAYSLLLTALLLVGGSLGDHYGRRKIFVLGVGLFSLASAWCGFAGDIRQLIFARALQGIGGALLIPGSPPPIISASFGDEDRGRTIGTWSGFHRHHRRDRAGHGRVVDRKNFLARRLLYQSSGCRDRVAYFLFSSPGKPR